MKTIKIVTLLILIPGIFSAQGISTIKGKLKNGKGTMVYLQQNVGNKMVSIDSSEVNKRGKYVLKTEMKTHGFYQVTSNEKDRFLLLLKGGNETINLESLNFKDKDYKIKNSKDNVLIQSYFKMKSTPGITKDSISKYAMKFIKENNKSLLIFIAINDCKDLKKAVEISEKGMRENYNGTTFHTSLKKALVQLKQQANKPKSVGIGEIAPELNLKNPEGKVVTLASLRGKYVLIDFWASWCGPCRRENPNVVRLYNKYKEKGFEVYSVSLDKQKSRWEAAIIKDGLIWKSHVSDLKGWRTIATKMYGFGGIPYTVLIDKKGKVIATRLRGVQLENKLKELFGE